MLILASTPFWMDTSWPHYFIYLPALQLMLLDALKAPADPGWTWLAIASCAVVSIVTASSVALLWIAGAWQPYSANGYLFVANAVVLAGAYLVIARQFSAPPATATAARTP